MDLGSGGGAMGGLMSGSGSGSGLMSQMHSSGGWGGKAVGETGSTREGEHTAAEVSDRRGDRAGVGMGVGEHQNGHGVDDAGSHGHVVDSVGTAGQAVPHHIAHLETNNFSTSPHSMHQMTRVIPAQAQPAWGGAGLPEERVRSIELASREQFPTLGSAVDVDDKERERRKREEGGERGERGERERGRYANGGITGTQDVRRAMEEDYGDDDDRYGGGYDGRDRDHDRERYGEDRRQEYYECRRQDRYYDDGDGYFDDRRGHRFSRGGYYGYVDDDRRGYPQGGYYDDQRRGYGGRGVMGERDWRGGYRGGGYDRSGHYDDRRRRYQEYDDGRQRMGYDDRQQDRDGGEQHQQQQDSFGERFDSRAGLPVSPRGRYESPRFEGQRDDRRRYDHREEFYGGYRGGRGGYGGRGRGGRGRGGYGEYDDREYRRYDGEEYEEFGAQVPPPPPPRRPTAAAVPPPPPPSGGPESTSDGAGPVESVDAPSSAKNTPGTSNTTSQKPVKVLKREPESINLDIDLGTQISRPASRAEGSVDGSFSSMSHTSPVLPSLEGLSISHPMTFGEDKAASFENPEPPGLFTSMVSDFDEGHHEDHADVKHHADSVAQLLDGSDDVDDDKADDVEASGIKTDGKNYHQFGDIMLPSIIDGCVPESQTLSPHGREFHVGRGRGRGRGTGRGRSERGRGGRGRGSGRGERGRVGGRGDRGRGDRGRGDSFTKPSDNDSTGGTVPTAGTVPIAESSGAASNAGTATTAADISAQKNAKTKKPRKPKKKFDKGNPKAQDGPSNGPAPTALTPTENKPAGTGGKSKKPVKPKPKPSGGGGGAGHGDAPL